MSVSDVTCDHCGRFEEELEDGDEMLMIELAPAGSPLAPRNRPLRARICTYCTEHISKAHTKARPPKAEKTLSPEWKELRDRAVETVHAIDHATKGLRALAELFPKLQDNPDDESEQ